MSAFNESATAPEIQSAPNSDEAIQAFAECLWQNQATLITQAAQHFSRSPALIATIILPVVLQAMADAHPDKRAMKRIVNQAIDKGFDDWLRNKPVAGGVQ